MSNARIITKLPRGKYPVKPRTAKEKQDHFNKLEDRQTLGLNFTKTNRGVK